MSTLKLKVKNFTDSLKIVNQSDKVAEIVIDGIIGGSFFMEDDGSDDMNVARANNKVALRNELRAIAEIDAQTIIVHIDSPGGSVFHALSMYDQLAENPAKIITRTTGGTASAATILIQAADPGERKMSDNAMGLIHRATGIGLGNADEIKSDGDFVQKAENRLVNIYRKTNTKGKTTAQIKKIMGRNNGQGEWMTAAEMKTNGFIDSVFEPMKVAAIVSRKALKAFNLPNIPNQKPSKMKIKNVTSFLAFFSALFATFVQDDDRSENKILKAIAKEADCKVEDLQEILDGDELSADDTPILEAFAEEMDMTLKELVKDANDEYEEEEEEEDPDEDLSLKDRIANWFDKNIKGKSVSNRQLKKLAANLTEELEDNISDDLDDIRSDIKDIKKNHAKELKKKDDEIKTLKNKKGKRTDGGLNLEDDGDADPGHSRDDNTGKEVLELMSDSERSKLRIQGKRNRQLRENNQD